MTDADRRVLITGATGFVGSHLVDALRSRDVRVRALVRSTSDVSRLEAAGVERVEGDLADESGASSALTRAVEGVDAIFHLAALTRARTDGAFERVNVGGTRALVRAIRTADPRPRRLVYLSSLAAAGPCIDGRPVCAADDPRPLTAYGRSKLGGEAVCLDAAERMEGLDVVVLRAPAVYGPRDRDLFTYFQLARGGFLLVPAGPERMVQLIHVTDLADALVRAATAPDAAGVYHAAEPRAYAWSEVSRLIGRAVGRRGRVVRVPEPIIRGAAGVVQGLARLTGRAAIFNRDKAKELLAPGWLCETERASRDMEFEAAFPLREGLAETASWYRAHGWL